MLDQAYRIIRTLEKQLALAIYTGSYEVSGKEMMCPFCKAKSFQKIVKTRTNRNITSQVFNQVLTHEKNCEIMLILEEMEEWGCRP